MPIPLTYGQGGEGSIASYSYTDIAEGTGVVLFNGYEMQISGAATYHLGEKLIASYDIYTSHAAGSGTWTFNLTPFNMPHTVRGTAKVRFLGGVNAAGTLYYVVTIQRVDAGGTAVDIGTASTDVYTSGADLYRNFIVPITLAETNFKKGEALRVVVVSHCNDTHYLSHDPLERIGLPVANMEGDLAVPSNFEVHIPFRLDL